MKKVIYLIFVFGILFLANTSNVYAGSFSCKVGDANCTVERIVREVGAGGVPVCIYEVGFGGERYYNYIVMRNDTLYGGTTYGSNLDPESLKKDDNAYLLGSAYQGLKKDYKCPTKSYIDNNNYNEVCFDNGSECKNGGSKLNVGTNFNETTSSKLIGDYSSNLKYAGVNFNNACDLGSTEMGNEFKNVCKYSDSKGNAILLYYNKNSTANKMIYHDGYNGHKLIMDNGANPWTYVLRDTTFEWAGLYDVYHFDIYYNEIKETINQCPQNLYMYKIKTVTTEHDAGIYSEEKDTYYYIYASEQNIQNESVRLFENKSCTPQQKPTVKDPESCGELLTEEMIDIINTIMTIIRIAVPIMLIGLIIYDLATAVFAGSDDKVTKAKGRAIKRVIIAIAVFFVPTLLNWLFDIVNDIWSTKFSGTCETVEKSNN